MLAVLLHPDCTIDMSHVPDWVEESIYRGHEGLRRHIRDWDDLWGEIEYLPRAITDLGTEILVESEMRTVGEVSGIALERTYAQVAESRDGLTWRIANYWDPAEALEAVGLRE
jgi:ketosteroid isomerase-like protein